MPHTPADGMARTVGRWTSNPVNEVMAETFDTFSRWWRIGALALVMATATAGSAAAQNVVAFVNGEPITALDIEQRSKLT